MRIEEVSSNCFHTDFHITVELVSSDILEELCKLPMRWCDIPWEISRGQRSARELFIGCMTMLVFRSYLWYVALKDLNLICTVSPL